MIINLRLYSTSMWLLFESAIFTLVVSPLVEVVGIFIPKLN